MFAEMFHELSQVIRNNHAAVFGILGTIAGAITNFVLERIKQGGKVTFTLIETIWQIDTVGVSDPKTKSACRVPSIDFNFHFRVFNSYPIPKSVSVLDVEIVPKAPKWWRRVAPLPIKTSHVESGTVWGEQKMNSDLQCEAHSFTRFWVSGHAIPDSRDVDDIRKQFDKAAGIRLKLLVSPKKAIAIFYPIDNASFRERAAKWSPQFDVGNRV